MSFQAEGIHSMGLCLTGGQPWLTGTFSDVWCLRMDNSFESTVVLVLG